MPLVITKRALSWIFRLISRWHYRIFFLAFAPLSTPTATKALSTASVILLCSKSTMLPSLFLTLDTPLVTNTLHHSVLRSSWKMEYSGYPVSWSVMVFTSNVSEALSLSFPSKKGIFLTIHRELLRWGEKNVNRGIPRPADKSEEGSAI